MRRSRSRPTTARPAVRTCTRKMGLAVNRGDGIVIGAKEVDLALVFSVSRVLNVFRTAGLFEGKAVQAEQQL